MSDVVVSGAGGTGFPVGASGTLSISGDASGASGAGSGIYEEDFWIEEQDLTIEYARQVDWIKGSHTFNLSSYSVTGTIYATMLYYVATANYSRKREIAGKYHTRYYTQPQKFEIIAASAAGGVAYGLNGVGGVSANQLGPVGTVVTKQKWYNRRPWLSTDTEVSKTIVGSNVAYSSSSQTYYGTCSISWNYPQDSYIYDHDTNFRSGMAYSWRLGNRNYPFKSYGYGEYRLPGPYAVAQETSPTKIWNLIDSVGSRLETLYLLAVPPVLSTNLQYPARGDFVGIAQYSKNRHDYT